MCEWPFWEGDLESGYPFWLFPCLHLRIRSEGQLKNGDYIVDLSQLQPICTSPRWIIAVSASKIEVRNLNICSEITTITLCFSFCQQGANSYGQLALGHKEDQLLPQMVKNCPDRIKCILGGGGHTAMLLGELSVVRARDLCNCIFCGANLPFALKSLFLHISFLSFFFFFFLPGQ